jgi:predicted HicB family RNase H-like nuclease
VVTASRRRWGVKEQVNLRLETALKDRVDARAADVGVTRNEWLTRAITWALDQPKTSRQVTKTTEEKV